MSLLEAACQRICGLEVEGCMHAARLRSANNRGLPCKHMMLSSARLRAGMGKTTFIQNLFAAYAQDPNLKVRRYRLCAPLWC